uniref:Ion_trans_2 domain-containing protein n=1 Tax=Syphacia muris TaxID=451379 RepID=A0A0N5AS33_9BILA
MLQRLGLQQYNSNPIEISESNGNFGKVRVQFDVLAVESSSKMLITFRELSELGQVKSVYNRYHLRYFAPYIILITYSVLGALLFQFLEADYEKKIFRERNAAVERLREETLLRLNILKNSTSSKDIFDRYDAELKKILNLSDNLEWDLWGAFYYVGTIYTTIGYGNIYPRTVFGKFSTVIYALIGIPLVLAILSQSGEALTKLVSVIWIRYRRHLRKIAQREKSVIKGNSGQVDVENAVQRKKGNGNLLLAEEGRFHTPQSPYERERNRMYIKDAYFGTDEDVSVESRTIPIWVALVICFTWIGMCAGMFCIWESNWSYYDSLYFFFVSLSTIGLGDVVPEHPHILILMFLFVIFGLSLVSMLLSIMQIKIEEFLFRLTIKLQKEYQKAVESGDEIKREEILHKIMKTEPWFVRNLAPHLISDKQAADLSEKVDLMERAAIVSSAKNWQSEDSLKKLPSDENLPQKAKVSTVSSTLTNGYTVLQGLTTYNDINKTTVEPLDSISNQPSESLQLSRVQELEDTNQLQYTVENINESEKDENAESISQNTSLTNELIFDYPKISTTHAVEDAATQASSTSLHDVSQQIDGPLAANETVQTDIAQFQLDEIKLKLLKLQLQTIPKRRNQTVGTATDFDDADQQYSHELQKDQAVQCNFNSSSTDEEISTAEVNKRKISAANSDEHYKNNTSQSIKSFQDESVVTDVNNQNLIDIRSDNNIIQVSDPSSEPASEYLTSAEKKEVGIDPVIKDTDTATCSTSSDVLPPEKRKRVSNQTVSNGGINPINSAKVSKIRLRHFGVQCLLWCENYHNASMQTDPEKIKLHKRTHSSSPSPAAFMTSTATSVDDESCNDLEASSPTMQDLIVQTDDSYLKIARRLDEIRSKRTGSLHVCAAKPLKRSVPTSTTNLQQNVADVATIAEEETPHHKESLRHELPKRQKSFMERMDEFFSTKGMRNQRQNNLNAFSSTLIEETAEASESNVAINNDKLLDEARAHSSNADAKPKIANYILEKQNHFLNPRRSVIHLSNRPSSKARSSSPPKRYISGSRARTKSVPNVAETEYRLGYDSKFGTDPVDFKQFAYKRY